MELKTAMTSVCERLLGGPLHNLTPVTVTVCHFNHAGDTPPLVSVVTNGCDLCGVLLALLMEVKTAMTSACERLLGAPSATFYYARVNRLPAETK